MLDKNRAVKPSKDITDDLESIQGKGWALYEEETSDLKLYQKGPSRGKPMKNVVIEFPNGPATMKVSIPREAFIDMVKKYFNIKGY